MCGIFAYKGFKNAPSVVKNNIQNFNYRGYDSWGIASLHKERIDVYKRTGKISKSKGVPLSNKSTVAIGHTRWATHGNVTNINAHPHLSSDGLFALIHNGIVENYNELKLELKEKGCHFKTQTDTEVIVRLIETHFLKNKDLIISIRKAFAEIQGRNTVLVLERNNHSIIAVKRGLPLFIGIKDEEVFLTSDNFLISNNIKKALEFNNNEIIKIGDDIKRFDLSSGKEKQTIFNDIKSLKDYEAESYMLKEILEQQYTIKNAVLYTYEDLFPLINILKHAEHIYTIGAGSAYFAASQIAYILRRAGKLNVTEIKPYEISSYRKLFQKDDVIIAVSQSGETTDTIEALKIAKKKKVIIASIVNMVNSTMAKMSDFLFLARSGPELSIVATKSFTSQIAWGYLAAYSVVNRYGRIEPKFNSLKEELAAFLSTKTLKEIDTLAKQILNKEHYFIIGKGKNYNIAREGALKIKEISYKHCEGITSGELEHGVLNAITQDSVVFVIVSEDENKDNIIKVMNEVKAKQGIIVGVARQSNKLFDHFIKLPDLKNLDPFVNIIFFQLIAYKFAINLDLKTDKPR